jgi:hypothetical protein
MFRIYNDELPLNDNFEIAEEATLTVLERISLLKDFFKESFKYLSFLYKIYNYIKSAFYYIYCFFSFIFIAFCCFIFLLFMRFLYHGGKCFVFFMIDYVKNRNNVAQQTVSQLAVPTHQNFLAGIIHKII